VRRGRERVIFVDPYFDHIDVREFAVVTMYDSVCVSILTGRGNNLFSKMTSSDDPETFLGDAFATDLEKLNAELEAVGRKVPAILLMGGTVARTYHDRFLLVDDIVWHFGHSFNQVGGPDLSVATRLLHPEEVAALIIEDILNASSFLTTWPTLRALRLTEQKQA
jgi:hypothetical protein